VDDLFPIFVTGTAQGVPLFIIASGLTLIYGVMHVLNFAHGAYFMIGAFVFAARFTNENLLQYVLLVALGGAVVAVIGLLCEVLVFRRLYGSGPEVTLLAAFALSLILDGATRIVWGGIPRTVQYPDTFRGATEIFGARISIYDLFLIGVGLVIAVGLFVLIRLTTFGRQMRAVAQDRTMSLALGVRSKRIGSLVFILGAFLAGAAGALTGPTTSIDLGIGASYIIPAFAVIIVGGVGSVEGALVASLVLNISESMLFTYAPTLSGFSFYIIVAVILMVRPQGLFGGHGRTAGLAR
jgi:branched-chain amino acid transport system permease protein